MNWLGPFCAFLSSCTWAIGSAGYSRMAGSHSAFAVNFSRAIIALPMFVIAIFVAGRGFDGGWVSLSALNSSHIAWFGLSMFASYGFGDVLFLWSTRKIGVPAALAIASAYPLWTAASGAAFRGEVLSFAQVAGLVMTVSGVGVVILSGARSGPSRDAGRAALAKGVTLAILTSFLWATNSFAVAHAGKGLESAVGNMVRMIWALLISGGLGLIFSRDKRLLLPMPEIKKWSWLFALEAFGGSYLFMYGLSNSPLAIGSTLASLAPVLSVPVAVAFKLERFSWVKTAGVLMVVLGIWLLVGGV